MHAIQPYSKSEAFGAGIYIRGRTIANGQSPSRAIDTAFPLYNQLVSLSRVCRSERLLGYACILLSNAYYLAGGYSSAQTKYRFYGHSIKLAKRAISVLPDDDHEILFALRVMVASAHYQRDQDTVYYVFKKAAHIIPKLPETHYINSLHLGLTMSKSLAALGSPNPFSIHNLAVNHFNKGLTGTGVYEISGIKEEIETLLVLGTVDKNYIRAQAKRGCTLAAKYKFFRQKRYFNRLLRTI